MEDSVIALHSLNDRLTSKHSSLRSAFRSPSFMNPSTVQPSSQSRDSHVFSSQSRDSHVSSSQSRDSHGPSSQSRDSHVPSSQSRDSHVPSSSQSRDSHVPPSNQSRDSHVPHSSQSRVRQSETNPNPDLMSLESARRTAHCPVNDYVDEPVQACYTAAASYESSCRCGTSAQRVTSSTHPLEGGGTIGYEEERVTVIQPVTTNPFEESVISDPLGLQDDITAHGSERVVRLNLKSQIILRSNETMPETRGSSAASASVTSPLLPNDMNISRPPQRVPNYTARDSTSVNNTRGRDTEANVHTSTPRIQHVHPVPRPNTLSLPTTTNERGGATLKDDDTNSPRLPLSPLGRHKPFVTSSRYPRRCSTSLCPRCGYCRCVGCSVRNSLPRCWCGGCECSAERIVECVTCMCCVKAAFYHGCVDAEEEDYAEYPCGCCAHRRCVARWTFLAFASIALPCLCLYWPARGFVAVASECHDARTTQRCKCTQTVNHSPRLLEEERESSSI